MTQQGPRTQPIKPEVDRRGGTRRWTVVALLFAAGFVNYLDRSTLAIANTDIARELHLSPVQMGALLSCFAWTYALCQLPVGAVVDRLGPRLMLFAGMMAWSVAQAASGAVRSFGTFLLLRGALGIGETPMFTAGARSIADRFEQAERGVPLGLFNAASSFGPAVAPPLLTGLMLAFGWRPMFVLMGVAGFVVALVWMALVREPSPGTGSRKEGWSSDLRAWTGLLAVRGTWAMTGGLFGIVYVTWLYVSWLPAYLEQARGLDTAATGWFAAVPQMAGFVGACTGGVVSDALARRGVDPVRARQWPTVGGLLGAAVFAALSPLVPDLGGALAAMSAALFCAYAASSSAWALGATVAPPDRVATVEALQNVGGSVGGALAPLVTGVVVERTGNFTAAFAIAAAVAVCSAISYALMDRDPYGTRG